jgi:hypothetical protein
MKEGFVMHKNYATKAALIESSLAEGISIIPSAFKPVRMISQHKDR